MWRQRLLKVFRTSAIQLISVFLGKEKVKSTFLLSVANVFSKLVGFLLPFVMIRYTNENAYGQFFLILNTLVTITALFSTGITNGVGRYLVLVQGTDKEKYKGIFHRSVSLLIILITVISFLFFWMGGYFFPEVEANKSHLFLGLVYIFFILHGSFLSGIHYVEENYTKLFRATLYSSLLHLVMMPVFTMLWGISGTLISYVLFSVVQFLFLTNRRELAPYFFFLGKKEYPSGNDKMSEPSMVKDFIFPVAMATFAPTVVMWLANNLIAGKLGYTETGFINIALQMQVIISFLPGIFNSMELPRLSQSFTEGKSAFVSCLKSLARKTLISSGVIFFLLILMSGFILELYSNSYVPFLDAFRLLLVAYFFSVLLNVVGLVIMSSASMWWGALLNLIWGLSFYFLLKWLLGEYGLLGYSMAFLFSYLIHGINITVYFIYFINKKFNLAR